MSTRRTTYLTTAIPYVNGDPHVGFALECVQADVLARHRRLRGDDVRLLSGTDDNSLKNVEAARRAGVPVADFVRSRGDRFAALRDALQLSYDDFIRTSVDRRHRPGVERLWEACAAAGDLYEREYEGLYCTGCEAFVTPDELVEGRCPEHGVEPERVAERNWFFRLSRHGDALLEVLESGRLRVEPAARRNEALALVRGGLDDFSVSRPAARAQGWGIPVPGDAGQVVYVWFDALANYVTALGYGTGDDLYQRWWLGADERVHVIGKGILRFHAVYWPAILRSAGEPLPTAVLVHDYLTLEGAKLSKSAGGGADPAALAAAYGAEALRWWFARDVPRVGDADFREEALAARADELADELGNLVSRVVALAARARPAGPTAAAGSAAGEKLLAEVARAGESVDVALARFDLPAAVAAVRGAVAAANRFVAERRPWEHARAAADGDAAAARALASDLAALLQACARIAAEVSPFLPLAAPRIERVLEGLDPEAARRLFPKRASRRRLVGASGNETGAGEMGDDDHRFGTQRESRS
jgi:methionyl-tRNA synthetase